MEIIKLRVDEIQPYEKNAKIHTPEQIEQIKKSIELFGMNDPIGVWGKDNIIVEGHGRLEALKELGYNEVECIRLDHLTDEKRKAYTLAHNKLTMNTDFDFSILDEELDSLETIDMADFGFEFSNINWDEIEELTEKTYEEPEKDLLMCPNCHHIDSRAHFKKVNSYSDNEKIILDNYIIENASLEDIDGIKKIADKNSNEIGFVLRPALEEHCKKGSLLVVKTNNKIIGFCNYNKRKDGVNIIYEICNDFKYRGNGIAKAMIDKLDKPIQLKCPEDNESNKFYEHIGFKLVDVEDGKKRKLNVWRMDK